METIETSGCGVEMENCTRIENEESFIPLATSIGEMLTCLPPISPNCHIFRVPRRLRVLNEKAYTPQTFSIGPLHHGKTDLIDMEEHKKRYLKAFLGRTTMKLVDCIRKIKEWEERARNCYAERIKLSSDEFVKMVLVDSSFIIEAIVRYHMDTEELWLSAFLRVDLILLENQIPFFVLEGLFNLAFGSYPRKIRVHGSFTELSTLYFSNLLLIEHIPDGISSSEVKHFVDLLRICHLPSSRRSFPAGAAKFERIQNAAGLDEAGMKFKVGSRKCFVDMQYTNGVLEIPCFSIYDSSEALLSNLIALEHFLYWENSYVLDCIYFMDALIDTPKDVEILVQSGILENWLGDNSALANLINALTKETWLRGENFYFYDISKNLNSYCNVPWHNWKATLKRDYFSSPWRVASTVAAIILLMLTFIQTICSLISL